MRAWWFAAAVAVPAVALAGWSHDFEDRGVQGVLTRDESGDLSTKCASQVPLPPAQVLAALLDMDAYGQWLPGTVEYRVVKRDGDSGTFYRKSEAPFFVPEMWANVDVKVERRADGGGHLTWKRTEGSIKVFDASWDVVPATTGSKVTYEVTTSVPLPAPAFILKRAGSTAIADTVVGLRNHALKRPYTPPPVAVAPAPVAAPPPSAVDVAPPSDPVPAAAKAP